MSSRRVDQHRAADEEWERDRMKVSNRGLDAQGVRRDQQDGARRGERHQKRRGRAPDPGRGGANKRDDVKSQYQRAPRRCHRLAGVVVAGTVE